MSNPSTPPSPAAPDAPASGAFFSRADWAAFWACFLVTLGVYTYTLAPTVTLEDSGELAVASDYLGVPHPPGYPIWTLITWFFQWVFHFVTYHGHPNPAWGVGFMSAVSGALACGILALLVSRSGLLILRAMKRVSAALSESSERLISASGGFAGGLFLAFSPGLWSQSVIVEVYSFNIFFLMIILLLAYRWMCQPADTAYLYATAFLFGLGLTNHQTLMFVGMALAAAVLFRDVRLFRDFAIVGLVMALSVAVNLAAGRLEQPAWMWKQGPGSAAFWIHTLWIALVPIVFMFILPRGRVVGITYLLALLGIAFYGYMPFASEGNPPMNWGYPRTWEGFLHAVTRGQYEKVVLSDILGNPTYFLAQLGTYFADLRTQFSLTVAMFGVLPFTLWSLQGSGRRIRMFTLGCALAVVATLLAMAFKFIAPGATTLRLAYKLVALAMLGIAFVGVAASVVHFVQSELAKGGLARTLMLLLLAGAALVLLYVDIHLFAPLLRPDTSGLNRALIAVLILLPPLMIVGIWWLLNGPLRLEFELDALHRGWNIVSIAAFLSLSVILVIFLNPKLDIQTLFIQRVQLLQSHAIYALWIGYGLILALAFAEVALGARPAVRRAGIALVLLLPLTSIWSNWKDEERIAIIGGAEQNGHDFGWQFGHWQLRGAHGIREDLAYIHRKDPARFEEEWAKFPNPDYPPEMTPNAIFFGGTDPGRFVPTYMIYSAKVRPDVFLITQNALADNTYMNVMRDLMGDAIWIPSVQDSNNAFTQFVGDVQSGRIEAGAAVEVRDGRVSVQGVQGVMIINGLLTRMIFDANKHAHDFYVEESYVIPWMYPHLSPHGLIMKINKEPLPRLTEEMVRDDRAFWDWYCERLLANPKFLRDVVARKTFSKLRSAIAGLYVYRGLMAEAEHAFKQAIALYPLSPEACFRLAEAYMQQLRLDDAVGVIEELLKGDPRNDKVAEFLAHLQNLQVQDRRRREIEAMVGAGAVHAQQALELASIYLRMGMLGPFQNLSLSLLNQNETPLETLAQLDQMFASIKRPDLREALLMRFVMRDPQNLGARLELAAVQAQRGRADASLSTLEQAIAAGGGEPARDFIRRDPRFLPLQQLERFKALVPQAPSFELNLPQTGSPHRQPFALPPRR